MAMAIMENGRKKKRGRKRNPKTATAIRKVNPVKPIKRRSISKSSVLAFAKRNGQKLVSRSANNPKHKRRKRRNPSTITRRSNPSMFGSTKKDAKEVFSLLAGLFGTKALGRFIIPYVQPYMAQINAAKYTELLIDGLIGLGLAPMVAKKFAPSLASQVRLGGAAALGIDLIEMVAPDTFNMLNPFNQNPIVLTSGGQPAIMPQAVKEIARDVESGATSASKVAGAMDALSAGANIIDYSGAGSNMSMMPLGGSPLH